MKKLFIVPLLLVLPYTVQAIQIEPDITLNPYEGESNDFGSTITTISDISGDAIGDLIVSTPNYGNAEGRIDIFFGKQDENLSTTPDFTITGGGDDEVFGDSFTVLPDVTGDGLPELIAVGQYATTLDDTLSSNAYAGIVYFFASEAIAEHSNATETAINFASAVLVGNSATDNIGSNVQVYNGAAGPYLVTSSTETNEGQGSVYIINPTALDSLFSNNAHDTIDSQVTLEVIGEEASSNFGLDVYAWSEGDYLVLGANQYQTTKGRAYFIPESTFASYTTSGNTENVTDVSNAIITSSESGAFFGSTITDAGPAEFGERYIAIEAVNYDASDTAALHILSTALLETIESNSGYGVAQTDATITLATPLTDIGRKMVNVNDQYFAVQGSSYNENTGATYVFRNATLDTLANDEDTINHDPSTVADFILYGDSPNQFSGFSLATFSEDIDGDDIDEFLIGTKGNTQPGNEAQGHITLVPSALWSQASSQQTATISSDSVYTNSGDITGDGYGWLVSGSEDLDNNGDVEIIATGLNSISDSGYVRVFYNLEDQLGSYEHILVLGHSGGNTTTQGVEERGYRSGSKVKASIGTAGKMFVTAGDVDINGDTETITTLDSINRCHTIYIYSGIIKDKQFRACHPNNEQTVAYISAGTYVSGSGQSYIAVVFPNETHGAYIQLYKRTSSGSYKKVHRKRIESDVDFSQGLSIGSGNLTSANSAQIVLAANNHPTLFVYKLTNANKLTKVTEKKAGGKNTSLHLAVDGSNQILYVSKWGKRKVKAYTWDGNNIVKLTANNLTPTVEPYGLAAEDGVVTVLKKNRKKLQLYYNSELVNTNTYSKKIWNLDLVNQ